VALNTGKEGRWETVPQLYEELKTNTCRHQQMQENWVVWHGTRLPGTGGTGTYHWYKPEMNLHVKEEGVEGKVELIAP